MAKKLKKFPFLFRPSDTTASWPWPAACVTSLRTLSFRADSDASLYTTTIDTAPAHSADPPSFSSASETAAIGGLTGLRSDDRLFFVEPGETNSILEVAKSPFKLGGVAVLALDSRDPFLDFRVSMEEMVEAHGLRDWHRLEELLTCYLRVNGKNNHGYIVGAFVDLLLNLAVASAIDDAHCSASSATQDSSASHISFTSCTQSSDGRQHCLIDDDNGEEIKIADTCCCCCSSSGP